MTGPLQQLIAELQKRWAPEWRVWRSRNDAGTPNGWCATYRGANPEISRTLMEPTPQELPRLLTGALGAPTVAFFQAAPRLILDTSAALTNVLETHRYHPHCIECGTRHLCRTIHRIGEILTPADLMGHGRV